MRVPPSTPSQPPQHQQTPTHLQPRLLLRQARVELPKLLAALLLLLLPPRLLQQPVLLLLAPALVVVGWVVYWMVGPWFVVCERERDGWVEGRASTSGQRQGAGWLAPSINYAPRPPPRACAHTRRSPSPPRASAARSAYLWVYIILGMCEERGPWGGDPHPHLPTYRHQPPKENASHSANQTPQNAHIPRFSAEQERRK